MAPKRYRRHKRGAATLSTWGAWALDGGPNIAGAEGVSEGSGLLIWPPRNTHPVDFNPQAMWDLEEPAWDLPLPGARAGEEELWGREVKPRRGGRRVQPVYRIIYTALGEPQEGSTHEPLR
ncbi:hypothetical protein P7K49_039304, partial [Saguinus oedipus]